MKIVYEDRSYVEVSKSNTPNKVFVTIAAKNIDDPHKLTINCVELTNEELVSLLRSVA